VSLARHAWAIARKDLLVELRGKHAVGVVLPFAGTLLIAFGLSFGPGHRMLEQTAPGLLWLAVLFASVLAFRGSYQSEGEGGAFEGLVLAPVDKAAVFIGKSAAVAAQLLVLGIAVVLLVAALFGLSPAGELPVVVGAFVLGTVGLAAVGGLFGVLVQSPRARETVFPLLVLPLVTPVLVAGVKATESAVAARGQDVTSWLGLLVAFDVLFVGAGTLVFGNLMEE
jgi:heme exporter protein B